MKKILFTLILSLCSLGIFSQGLYNNGGKIVIGSGVTIYISGTGGNYRNETNTSNGSMDLAGKMVVQGNITNNVAAADMFSSTAPGSEVALTGTTAQTLGGLTTATATFANLTINNSTGVLITRNAVVNGTMTLTTGLVDIGNNNFTFGPIASVAGTPSATSMIIATGTGQVMKDWSAIGTFTFPVGDNNITAKYSPVTLNVTAGTFAAGASTGLNLVNAKFNDPGITGDYLNRFWNITQTGITGFTCDAMFQYAASDVVGTEANISTLRVVPTPFTIFSQANTSLHQLSATGLTSFGTFTGGPGMRVLNIKLYLQSLYAGGGLMTQTQGLAGNQFPGTTTDQISIELHDPITYLTQVYSANNINLSTAGLATVNIPASFNGSYYLTVKHRNSIGVVSAAPVAFSTPTINYDFSTAQAQAFAGNMIQLGTGIFGLFGGDSNADGTVDGMDMINIENAATLFTAGYVLTDLNGDGAVDALDMIVAENNALNFIFFITP